MKIIEIEYSELTSEGFTNRRVGARAQISESEDPKEKLNDLRKWVRAELGIIETLNHYQKVQIAREIMNEYADREIPF